jgi:hypothetical protein
MGLTLVGFLRGTSMNVYSVPDRIRSAEDDLADGLISHHGQRSTI